MASFTYDSGRELRGLSLCAGYAGLDLGLHIAEPGYKTVCYVERESHAAATLVARMEDQALVDAPIWDDLKSFDGRAWRGRIHLIAAGYPCQPFSFSGHRKGRDDPRHLWPDIARIIAEVEPEWVFAENVEGHLNLGCADVCDSLRSLGYTPKAGLFSAREAGASHRRGRIFILAHANSFGFGPLCRSDGGQSYFAARQDNQSWPSKHRPNAIIECCSRLDSNVDGFEGNGLAGQRCAPPLFAPGPGDLVEWQRIIDQYPYLQPALLRADHGLANRVDESRACGNGVCSMAAALAWSILKADFIADAGGLQ